MILHEKTRQDTGSPVREWWVVDVDSLTLARCQIRGRGRISIRYVRWDKGGEPVETFPGNSNFGEAAVKILIDCHELHPQFPYCAASVGELEPAELTSIPEYILLSPSAEEPAEAIIHTVEPLFIAVFPDGPLSKDPKDQFVAYRLGKPLPPAGWEYWRTDAWQEFGMLPEEYRGPETGTCMDGPYVTRCR